MHSRQRTVLFLVFAVTGFSALTLQVVWQRVISLHAGVDLSSSALRRPDRRRGPSPGRVQRQPVLRRALRAVTQVLTFEAFDDAGLLPHLVRGASVSGTC